MWQGAPPGVPSSHTLAYQGPGRYYEPPKPNGWRAKVVIPLALGLAVLSLAGVGIEICDYRQFDAAEAGTLTLEQEQTLVYTAIGLAIVYLLAAVVFFVFFFMWLYRAVKNVRITSGDSRSGPGMSVGWWFIPFANLVMPYSVLKDLWERARVDSSVPWVGSFWLIWIFSGLVGTGADRMYTRAVETGDFDTARSTIIVSICVAMGSAVSYAMLAWIVNSIQRVQEPE